MRHVSGSRLVVPALLAVLLGGVGGCGVVSVEMTSSPEVVRSGDLVTFDIKLTNQSPCPLDNTVAILIPFIPQGEINAEFNGVFGDIPSDAPPEILEFIQALQDFLNELCAGGTPAIPTPPTGAPALPAGLRNMNAECHRGEGLIECSFSMQLSESANEMSFSLLDGRMDCEVRDRFARCEFEIPLPQAVAGVGGAAAVQQLNCLTPEELGVGPEETEIGELGAVCFVGSFPMFEGLGGSQMATGQVVLPARGAGVVRNLIIAISPDPEEIGVCEGGSTPGSACDLDSSEGCPGGDCAPGICVGGDNPGTGCDAPADCVAGTCEQCEVEFPEGALPIDCTTTYISPEAAPLASGFGLVVLALALAACGVVWLNRRTRVSAE